MSKPSELEALAAAIEKHGVAQVTSLLAPLLTDERRKRIETVLAARLGSVAAIIEDTYDPHNAAAAIRTTEALGLARLHAVEPCAGLTTKGITRGCHRWIDIPRWPNPAACVSALHAQGFRVYATRPDATHDVESIPVDGPVAVMFGNEHAGLSDAALAACDGSVAIAMHGFTESFNLSVSVALVMSRLATRRRALLGKVGDLDPDTIASLRARFYAAKFEGVGELIERSLAAPLRVQ